MFLDGVDHMRAGFPFIGWGAVALLLVTFCSQQSGAALPPLPIPRAPAPEVLEIEVLRVFKIWAPFASNFHKVGYEVWVVANVKSVGRTGTGLKQGSRITLHYEAFDLAFGWCGPASHLIPSKGDVCTAELQADGRVYIPYGSSSIALVAKREK
jgi:hypothetical protein